MCGRFVRYVSIPEIATEFDTEAAGLEMRPSYNIPPGQYIAIILDDGTRKLAACRWGFLPSWARDAAIGSRMINARSETVWEKPAFRSAFLKQRCLVAANGFYEWKTDGAIRTPVYIRLRSRTTFGFGGLYNRWKSHEGKEICTTTIITTEANEKLKTVHNRMPVILAKEQEALWLDQGLRDRNALVPLMRPYPPEEMELIDVSNSVNSPAHDSPDCIEPV